MDICLDLFLSAPAPVSRQDNCNYSLFSSNLFILKYLVAFS